MLQSKQILLELNEKLAETLTSKGVTATGDETTTALVNKVANITSGDDSVLRGLIQRDLTEMVIPYGITSIGTSAFYGCRSLTNITIPNSVTSIGDNAFLSCLSLTNITIPDSVISIGNRAFSYCYAIKEITLDDGFNANNLDLSSSNQIDRETMINMFNALVDRAGLAAYTLTLGSKNLAKLTEQDILIATNKNWTLA